jgi:hypothetical protein
MVSAANGTCYRVTTEPAEIYRLARPLLLFGDLEDRPGLRAPFWLLRLMRLARNERLWGEKNKGPAGNSLICGLFTLILHLLCRLKIGARRFRRPAFLL